MQPRRFGLSMQRGRLLTAFTLLVIVIGSGRLALAQGSTDRAVDRAQQAVREQILNRAGERDLIVRFDTDPRTAFPSQRDVQVRGTGVATRADGQARAFAYEALVNSRNSKVSNVQYDWRGDWSRLGDRTPVTNRLTGTYRLNVQRSDNAATTASRVTQSLPAAQQQRLRLAVTRRLEAPESLAIEREGQSITLASPRAAPVTFQADGREQIEESRNGRQVRTTARLSGDRLTVATNGDRAIDYQVTFEPIDSGRSLRVTRRVTHEELRQPVVAQSVYDRTSAVAQFDVYAPSRENARARDASRNTGVVQDGTVLVAVLSGDLSTKQARDEDTFTMTVRSPAQYVGAILEGTLAGVARSGKVSGRAEISFAFDTIGMRDGRRYPFDGVIESVRTPNGDDVRVENEGQVQDESSQTGRTVTRTGIGAAIGAVIGAISGGGKGAAIGAAVGAGAGAGSVFIQGRDDLELKNGTEFTIRAIGQR